MGSLCNTTKNSPRSPQLEKPVHSNKDPAQPKIKKNKIIFKILSKGIINPGADTFWLRDRADRMGRNTDRNGNYWDSLAWWGFQACLLSNCVSHVCYTCYFGCCCFSVAKSCFTLANPWTVSWQVPLSSTISWGLLKSTLSQWCCVTISPSAAPFSFCHQSFPASGSFPMSQLFASGGWSIGAFSFSISPPMNIQGWFPLGWTGLMSLQSKGTLKSLLQHNSKASILQCSAFSRVQHFLNSHFSPSRTAIIK